LRSYRCGFRQSADDAIDCQGPLQKLNAHNNEWVKPAARSNFGGRQTFAPPSFIAIRQIDKRASQDSQLLEMWWQDSPEL
jgi:hypothetical protein